MCDTQMQVKQRLILLFLVLSFLTCCSQDNNKFSRFEKPGYRFPYQLAEPDKSWKLPPALVEISGLGFAGDQRLACVQDELGEIYLFDLKSGKVEKMIAFGDPGDYEGIEIVGKDAWVLKSNGTLYRVADYLENADPVVKKFTTGLSGKNDTEGLAYDPVTRNLLIACKEFPFLGEEKETGFKAIYRFNLETKQLDETPFLLISPDTFSFYKGNNTFKPSGIAIHPATGDLFILGSAGKLLLVFSGKGELLAMVKLDGKLFRQPEGICFSPEGVLYIASEGDGLEGMIYKFDPTN
jgi:uncharacterized protein YjiK